MTAERNLMGVPKETLLFYELFQYLSLAAYLVSVEDDSLSGPAPLDGLASSDDAEDVAGDATLRAAHATHL